MDNINFRFDSDIKNIFERFEFINDNLEDELLIELNHLVLVANKNESEILFNYLTPIKTAYGNKYNDKILVYESKSGQRYYIAQLYNTPVVATVLNDMGSIKTNAAILVMTEAIQIFQPKFATILGICASLNSNVKLGDVIIANPIISYDSKKEKNDITIYRGQRFYPYLLINRFDHANLLKFKNFKVFKGELVSGETLSDSAHFRNELKAVFPETLGLDMEGIGFATACAKFNVQWLLIKGVSDDGENKTDTYQKYAVDNAIKVSELLFSSPLNSALLKPEYLKKRSVFISGALFQYEGAIKPATDCLFARVLTKKLLEKNYRIVTALGKIIGDEILRATYEYIATLPEQMLNQDKVVSKYLMTIPFPYSSAWHRKNRQLTKNYVKCQRSSLIKSCCTAIFIFGNKKRVDLLSEGMDKEFMIAQNQGCLTVPIGATKLKAQELWNNADANYLEYYKNYISDSNEEQLRTLFELLNDNYDLQQQTQCELLADKVIEFIECASIH